MYYQKNKLLIQTKESKKFKTLYLKRLIPYIKIHKKEGITASLCMFIVSLLALPTPYLMKFIIDDVVNDKNLGLLTRILLLLIGIQLIKLIFSFLTSYLFGLFNQEILAKVKKNLFHHLLRLPLSFFDKHQSGYLLSRISEVEGLRFFFSNSLIRLLIGFLEFIFSLVILFYLNWRLTLIALLILPLLFLTTRFYSGMIRKLSREVMEKAALLSRKIQDTLSGVDVVKVFSAEERETSRLHNFLDDVKQVNIKRNVILTFSSELLSFVGAAGGFIVLWYSGWNIIQGDFTVGSYIAFSGYLAKLYGPTQMLASLGLSFQPAITSLERYSELMECIGEEESDKGMKVGRIKGEVKFMNVFFGYDDKLILKGVNFTIYSGEKVLLTGKNGSGKSTIVKLLLGLYKPEKGSIRIDGSMLEELSLMSLRERVNIVSQNTFLFNDTIRNNILYSKPDAEQREIEDAAREAGASEFIGGLNEGFDTVVGETGKRLSGGEKQKISIARAILRDADVVIFDEASTHLDEESERRMGNLIKNRFRDKICIIISHKPAFLDEVDRVFKLEGGKVVEKEKIREWTERNHSSEIPGYGLIQKKWTMK